MGSIGLNQHSLNILNLSPDSDSSLTEDSAFLSPFRSIVPKRTRRIITAAEGALDARDALTTLGRGRGRGEVSTALADGREPYIGKEMGTGNYFGTRRISK